jgi:hypothetical protein
MCNNNKKSYNSINSYSFRTTLANATAAVQERSFYGAWWIPFVIGGILSFLTAIPMFGFARQLPSMFINYLFINLFIQTRPSIVPTM